MPTAFMSMLPRPCATGLLRPKRLFEVDGTTGGAPSSHCGLEARGGHGLPPATAPSIMPESARGELQGGPPPKSGLPHLGACEAELGNSRVRWRCRGAAGRNASRSGVVRQYPRLNDLLRGRMD